MSNPWETWIAPTQQISPLSKFHRVKQIDDVHCGPATIQMLLTHLDITVSQPDIDNAINARDFIDERGTRPDELGRAVSIVAPQAQLWCKEHTTVEELEALVQLYKYPVGVEWQNLFYESIEEEYQDTDGHPEQYDFGHYSIVSHIDVEADEVVMVDPYHEFNDEYRYFSLRWFRSRWWDVNPIKDPHTGHIFAKRDEKLSFIITLKGTPFPKLMGMRPL